MVDTKAKYEALVAAYGGEQTQKTESEKLKSGKPQQVTDTKAKYEALLAVHGDNPKPKVATRSSMPSNEQIVAGARRALQAHQTQNQQIWNKQMENYRKAQQEKAAANAAAMPPDKKPPARLPETESLLDWRAESYAADAMTTAQRAQQSQKDYDEYIASDEYKAVQLKSQAAKAAAMMQGSGIHTAPIAGQNTGVQVDMKEVELRAIRDYYKRMVEQEAEQAVTDANMKELESWSKEDLHNLQTYIAERNAAQINGIFTGPQLDNYNLNPIVQKYGIAKVRQMAETYEWVQNEELAKDVKTASKNAVNGKFLNGAGHSVASVGANLIGSMTSLPGRVLEIANRTGQYKSLQQHTPGDMLSLYGSTVRGQVAENISGDQYDEQGNLIKDGGGLRQAAAYAYEGLMSSADSLARVAVGGGSKAISLGLAATGSFSQTVSDASQRGASPAQAIALGVVNGGLEVATEYLPLEGILKVAKGGPVPAKQLFKNIFKQAAIEVSEEEVSFLGSLAFEALILREKSGYQQQIAQAVANGASYEDAVEQANLDVLWEAVETAITSAFSGGISGTVSSGAANVRAEKDGKKMYGSDPDALINEALEIDGENELAKKLKEKADSGKKITGRELFTLGMQNMEKLTQQDKQAIQLATENRLTQLGETGNIKEIAQVLTKQAAGEGLTRAEERVLENSRYGQRVANELDAQNIRSGGYSSDWARKIGTDQIHVAEYNEITDEKSAEATTMDTHNEPTAETVQEPEKVRISDSGTAMLASPVGVENTREQFAEAKRVAAQYGVDIFLYTEYDTDRESYVEDGSIYINTESKTPFESIVQGYVQGQYQTAQAQVEVEEPDVQQVAQTVSKETVNVAQQGQNVTAAPLSVAAQIRQNQNLNGGNTYETDATVRTAPDAGAGILHGSGQRNDGAGTGEQTGSMAGRAGQTAQGQAVIDRRRATIDRRNRIGSLRLQKISSAELGISSGTDARNIQLVPQEHWDAEMEQIAERIYQETGKNVSYVMGNIQIRGKDGRLHKVKGVITGDRIIVQADHLRFSVEQIADHEAYHGRVSYFGDGLNHEIRQHILQKFTAEEFQNVVTKYVEAMQGIYSTEELQSGEAFEQLMNQIQEEIFADAYAGINAFGAGADRFTSAVNEKMEQLGLGRFRSEENGVRETNGPPSNQTGQKENTAGYGGEKYSIDERFESMIDSWDGKTIGFSFVVGETSDALQEAGIPKKQIRWDASKIKTLLEKHNGMTLETVKQIPELLEHPIIVIDSKKGANSKIVMGDLYDDHGKIVTAVLLLTPTSKKGNVLDIIKISSAEGRSHIKSLFTAENGIPVPVRYADKKRIQSWLNVNRLQLPLHNLDSDSKMIIDDPGDGVKEKFSVDDIRYSVDDEVDETDFVSVQAAMNAQGKEWSEMYLRDQLGDKGYEKYRAWEKTQKEQQKQQSRERTKQRNAEKQEARNSATKPVAESRPIEAKRELRSTLMDLFSIPVGSRGALGNMIDSFADRLIKNGTLTEDDRRRFFDRMYDEGVMTVPADDYFSEGRSLLAGGRVYVPESVKADFGDDWGDFRRRAFGARIYFTSDRSAAGIDSWNHELASELPGMFDEDETDLRSILERIVDVAEEGRDEKMSLADYTAMLADRGDISEEEFLNDMERKMDEALRTFAKLAKLEVKLRDRTGIQIAKEREVHRELSQRQRDRSELRDLQQRTLKTLQWLNKNRNRAPEELQAAFDEVLSDIDIYAVGAANEMNWSDRYNATWKDLAQMYKDASKNDPNFLPSKELEMIVGRLDGTKIADMDLGALNDLYKAAIGLRTEFYNRNNVINDEMQRLFEEVYSDTKREISSAPGEYTGKKMDKLLNLEQLTPMNVLQRMGGWDPNGTFYSMAKQLEKGERDMRAYSVKAKRMLQDFLTEHEDWVKKADGQGKDGIWYEVEIPQLLALEVGKKPVFGATVKVSMTPAQKVHMYLESKNVDNLRHMTGGRTFADKDLYSEGKRQEALAQGRTIRMAPETVKAIVSDLTAEEMELARLLEQYYNSFATKEINRVSNILYGYDKAMGKNYAPIYTNRNYTKAEFGVFDSTAEGVGNLKGRQYAVNPSYNISAFDAFEKHVDQTARFVGMAIPARNWTTLMNWRESNNSTADVITHKWGEEGKRYITDLITTLQAGEDVKTDPISSMANKLQSTYITAIFGANPSIVLKQLGSIPLASAYLDAKNVPKPGQIKNIDRDLISKYTQDLQWRTMGYSMPETRQLKENPNWTQTNKFYNFTFGGGAITAMDGWAASVLWPWAENKVRSDFPELEMGTQEQIQNGESPFYKKVAELFEDAVARSQSTSDEMHQSSIRKSKNPIAKAFTMFRSDSAQTYNTLRQKIGEAQYFARTGAKEPVQEAAKKAVGAAFVSLLMNAMWSEGINFLMALWKNKGKYYRDEEEELTFQSVAGEMVSGILGSFAGVVTGGEELLEIIGNLLTGDKLYDIETPGMEQLNDVIAAITSAGGGMREIIAGAVKVAVNGGNMGQYFKENGRDILGCIKDLAETFVMYMPGMPMSGMSVSNVEAYLLGAVKWISPELGAAYDDLFQNIDKSDLSGLTGGALEGRINRILRDRSVSKNRETAEVLAGLYEAGHKSAVPGKIPTSVTVDGESQELDAAMQNRYSEAWSGIVKGTLDDLVRSDDFVNAEQETQAKMVSYLYDYAGEMTKAELFEGYEPDSRAARYNEMVDGGIDSDLAHEVQVEMYKLDAADAPDVEYWRYAVKVSDNEYTQMTIMGSEMDDDQFKKLKIAHDLDVSPDMYVTYYETRSKYDADGNKSYSNAEVKAVIDAMGKQYSNEQKGVLWQMATGSTSTKNNPYSKAAGQKWLDAKAAEKEKG